MALHLGKILLSEEDIKARVCELGAQMVHDYKSEGVEEITVICITNGAIIFTADLLRKLDMRVKFESIRVASYGDNTCSNSEPEIADVDRLDVRGDHVLLVDDIIDTGRTGKKVVEVLKDKGASSVRACMLLDKPARREVQMEVEYVGFSIPDEFVVGYGMDYAGNYRNLPYIGVLVEREE